MMMTAPIRTRIDGPWYLAEHHFLMKIIGKKDETHPANGIVFRRGQLPGWAPAPSTLLTNTAPLAAMTAAFKRAV